MNYTSEAQERYVALREETAQLLDKAQELLNRSSEEIAECQPGQLDGLAEKLRNDRFNLVLTGGFQTGKSTMFCYLCGGRELSPVGAGGGGIRTSGVRVAAIPVQSGKQEYAIVKWRTADELLASLGSWLVPHYVEARLKRQAQDPLRNYITSDDIDLQNENARKKLAALAIEKLNAFASKAPGTEIEQARMALLIAWFAPYFLKHISQQESQTCYNSLKDVVSLASYPSGWEQRWKQTRENGWHGGFTKEDVAFIFIHSIEYHIDSPYLRQLGCCLIDSPGLSASKWDSDIAAQCMKESDIVLYLFNGSKEISIDDCVNVNTCAEAGAESKLLFGANLRMAPFQWKKCQEASIPKLETEGYKVPAFFNFHAGLALRTSELCALDNGALHSSSEAAIDRALEEIGAPTTEENRKQLLTNILEDYLSTFTKENQLSRGKTLRDYTEEAFGEKSIKYPELEELSGIPTFVKAARREVLTRKKESLLRRNGSARVKMALEAALDSMKKEQEALHNQQNCSEEYLTDLHRKTEDFEKEIERARDEVDKQFRKTDEDLKARYSEKLINALDERRNEIISLTAQKFVGPWDAIGDFKNPWAPASNEVMLEYNQALTDILRGILHQLCKVIAHDIYQTTAYDLALNKYNEICVEYHMPTIKSLVPHMYQQTYMENAPIPGWGGDIMEIIRQGNLVAMVLKFIPGTTTVWERAEKAVNACWGTIINGMHRVMCENIFYRCWEQDTSRRGPLQQMWDVRDAFVNHLYEMLNGKKESLKRAHRTAIESKEQTDARSKRISALYSEAESLLQHTRTLDNRIENELNN